MSQSLSSRTVEVASGVNAALPFNLESSNSYYYPLVQVVPGDLGGASKYSLVCAASDNAAVIKSSAGQLYGFHCTHIDATPVFIRFYDQATAPTLGSSTSYLRFGAEAATTAAAGKTTSLILPWGIPFTTGIGITVSTALTDSGTGNLTASEVVLTVFYK